MTPEHHRRGGAPVAVLSGMEPWEARLVLSLRLWCEGAPGQKHVRKDFDNMLPSRAARQAWRDFDMLVTQLITHATRPMVRHDVRCNCVGSDECVFAHLIATASDGHLNDAALIATLLVGPAHAEHVAILAGQVGCRIRDMSVQHSASGGTEARRVVRLH